MVVIIVILVFSKKGWAYVLLLHCLNDWLPSPNGILKKRFFSSLKKASVILVGLTMLSSFWPELIEVLHSTQSVPTFQILDLSLIQAPGIFTESQHGGEEYELWS